jgi:hypothetical protein
MNHTKVITTDFKIIMAFVTNACYKHVFCRRAQGSQSMQVDIDSYHDM